MRSSCNRLSNGQSEAVALFRFVDGQIIGPVEFSVLGMAHAQQAGSSSFYAQPLMAQPVPLEDASAEVVPEVPRPEARLRERQPG